MAEASSSLYRHLQDEEDAQTLDRVSATPRRLRKTTMPTTVEKLQEELRLTLSDLEEKQRDAMMAAEYGSVLLQANDKLRSEVEEITMKLESAYESTSALHSSLAEQSTENAHLRTTNTVLTGQVRDAQKENQIILQEFYELREQLEEATKKNKTIHALQERKRELEEGLEKFYALHEAHEEVLDRENALQAKHRQLQVLVSEQEREMGVQRDHLHELQAQISSHHVDQQHISTLRHQLEQNERVCVELREEKRILQEMPLLSQFGESRTLKALLLHNRALMEGMSFDAIESESKAIVDSLIAAMDGPVDPDIGTHSDGTPTNAFFMLTAILTHRRYEEIERKWRTDSAALQETTDELSELRSQKQILIQNLERSERLQNKAEKALHGVQLQEEEKRRAVEEECSRQAAELNRVQEQVRSQSHHLSASQADNEERLKRRIEELAQLEVEVNTLRGEKQAALDQLRTSKAKLAEAGNRNSEFQDIVRRINLEKSELQQQVAAAQTEASALQKTKESLQEKLGAVREQYSRKQREADALQGDLLNLQELCAVAEEQMALGKEEIDLLQKHNDLLHTQMLKEREKNTAQTEAYRKEIQELNQLIQMMQALEEEQLELDAQVRLQGEGKEEASSAALRKENADLKKKVHDAHREASLQAEQRLLEAEQLALLEDEIQFLKDEREQEKAAEEQHRKLFRDQIRQLEERLINNESSRVKDIANLEALKLRTFSDLQQQLSKERSINQANAAKITRLQQQNREQEVANQDLVSSMSRMMKDSGLECKRMDELEDLLRQSLEQHQQDDAKIFELEEEIRALKGRLAMKRPYLATLPPPVPLVIDFEFPPSYEEKLARALPITTNPEPVVEVVAESSSTEVPLVNVDEDKTDQRLLEDVFTHIRELLPSSGDSPANSTLGESILLCNLINQVQSDTVDIRAINLDPQDESERRENFNLCLNSAKAIGCDLPDLQAEDLLNDPQKLEKFTWEVVRTELLSHVSLRQHPELIALQQDMQLQAQMVDIQSLTPQELLLQWVNYHLAQSADEKHPPRVIQNFHSDLESLEVQFALLKQLCSVTGTSVGSDCLEPTTSQERLVSVTKMAAALDCQKFLYPNEAGNEELNVAFLSNLLHHHSGLRLPIVVDSSPIADENDTGTREERGSYFLLSSLLYSQPFQRSASGLTVWESALLFTISKQM